MNEKTRRLVKASMLAAVICVVTVFVKIPSPFKGYLNLGDAFVLIAGWILLPAYGFFSAGIGSALADIFSGYAVYAPVTFIIKALMAVIVRFVYTMLSKKIGNMPSRIFGAILSELLMAFGYFAFEGVLYGYEISALNMPINLVQGLFGIIVGVALISVLGKSKSRFIVE